MVKNFLKRTLCIALSFAMMTGTVMVGAKTKTESIHSKLPAITASQRVRAKQAKASAEAVQLNATNVYTLSDFDTLSNKWQANQEMMLYQGYSDANEYVKVGTIRVGIDGTVVIPYATKVAGVDGGRLKLCYNGNPAMTLSQTNNGKMIWAGAVKAGTYALYLETACENANTPVVAAFGAAVISSQNNRTFGGNNVIASASTGAATYQQFKVSKRGVAAIAVYKENSAGNVSSVTYSVQKLSGKTWKTVATGLAGATKNNYVVTTGLQGLIVSLQMRHLERSFISSMQIKKHLTVMEHLRKKQKRSSVRNPRSRYYCLMKVQVKHTGIRSKLRRLE